MFSNNNFSHSVSQQCFTQCFFLENYCTISDHWTLNVLCSCLSSGCICSHQGFCDSFLNVICEEYFSSSYFFFFLNGSNKCGISQSNCLCDWSCLVSTVQKCDIYFCSYSYWHQGIPEKPMEAISPLLPPAPSKWHQLWLLITPAVCWV